MGFGESVESVGDGGAVGGEHDIVACQFCASTVARKFWDAEWAQTSDNEHVCPICMTSGKWSVCRSCEYAWLTTTMAEDDLCDGCDEELEELGGGRR